MNAMTQDRPETGDGRAAGGPAHGQGIASTPAAPTALVVVEEFKPVIKNTLRGFARVRFLSGMIMREIGIHTSNGKCWASPPSRPKISKEGVQLVRDGKRLWDPLIEFTDKGTRDRWSALIVNAVHEAHPTALVDADTESEP